MLLSIFLHKSNGFLLKCDNSDILISLSRILSSFRIFLKSLDINDFDLISSQNWWFTSQMWHDSLLIQKLIRSRIFSGFFSDLPSYSFDIFFWQNYFSTYQIWYDNCLFCNFIQFPFFPIFSGYIFPDFLQILVSLFKIKVYSAHEVGV